MPWRFPRGTTGVTELFVGLGRGWSPGGTPLLVLKFAFGLLTVLLPTVLMGGTLPVVTRLLTRSLSDLQQKLAGLYFINSAGAVVGTYLADFWWLPSLGLEYTMFTRRRAEPHRGRGGAVRQRLDAGGRSRWWPRRPARPRCDRGALVGPAGAEPTFTPGQMRLAVLGAGLSGFVAMLYQVGWTRMLALALGSSTHAFSLMLITFIAGIAVGSWLVYRWRNLGNPLKAFAWIELALAGTVLALDAALRVAAVLVRATGPARGPAGRRRIRCTRRCRAWSASG